MPPLFGLGKTPEKLSTSFGWLSQKPFRETDGDGYAARYERGCYHLRLARDSFFAWETLSSERRFGDFILEADMELDPGNGHSSVGVVLRAVNDENFYSLLISSRGNYRFDLLFNRHPLRLVEWTPLPDGGEGSLRQLRVIAHGSHFTFQVDDEWVGEIDDETIPSGTIGFAAQNYTGAGPGVFRLRRLLVDAQPMAVEKEHLRWVYYFPVNPAARGRLAETLSGMGSFSAAVVQLRKALKDRDGNVREHLLLAECLTRLAVYDEALAEMDLVLGREPGHREARLEKGNLLYLSNRLLAARDHALACLEDQGLASGAALWNLLGNAEYGLGNWDKAATAYRKASALQPDEPLVQRNAARSLERAGHPMEALELYLDAARVFFRTEAYDELALVVPRVLALDPSNAEVRSLDAKMRYHEGKTDEACEIFSRLEREGQADSAALYLLGIILVGKGRRRDALPLFERAAEMDPSFPLYQFRLAETRHFLGSDPQPPLQKALALAPDDPWSNNLAGLLRMEAGDPAGAIECFQRALAGIPQNIDIRLNLSDALARADRPAEALESLAGNEKDPRISNQRGNILARTGEHARAVVEYEAAVRLDPGNPVYKENCAAACIEVDMVHRADELLSQIEPGHPSPSVYNLLGNVAIIKGERARASAAYEAGLALDPRHPDLLANLGMLRLEEGRAEEGKSLLESAIRSGGDDSRAARVLERWRREHEDGLACSACGRTWWVPKDLPPQPGLKIRGEPPADAPAGRCPKCGRLYCVSCASAHTRDMRFFCPDCGDFLRLSDDSLKWLLARSISADAVSRPASGHGPDTAGPGSA